MTDPAVWEKECLDAIVEGFPITGKHEWITRIELSGSFPDTELLVEWDDPRYGERRSLSWRLWKDFKGAAPVDVEREVVISVLEA